MSCGRAILSVALYSLASAVGDPPETAQKSESTTRDGGSRPEKRQRRFIGHVTSASAASGGDSCPPGLPLFGNAAVRAPAGMLARAGIAEGVINVYLM